MTKKIILITASLFVIYTILIYAIKPKTICLNQGQINVVKLEDYVFGEGKKYVIVGSSLSHIYITSPRSEDYSDLAFPGSSIYDGLEIIKKSGFVPRVIFIEANYYHKITYWTLDMNTAIFMPVVFQLKRNIPSLQEKYQPMNILIPYVNQTVLVIKNKINDISKDDKPGHAAVMPSRSTQSKKSAFEVFLKLYMEEYSKIPDKKVVDKSVTLLKKYTKYFREKGVKIVFYEMPVDKKLCPAPQAVYLRTYLRKQFKPGDYGYIPVPDCSSYKTGDGIHLNPASQVMYKNYFFQEVDKILNVGSVKKFK